ncbi:uncharacterized protein YndB with AHSA1/START domain [Lutibacter sp. Hel_I_33_5]|uniref:SRPBCC family protein n=1 Tax=Lutibacter sp. Hel_I_33_5 TaxID=1566289 RepID=UPI0011A514FB|nr:SRPBCC domain-containing protein [Lutibacter sp. Hel_I_33_5]TVZ57187.1 uncharacterized protein YndB with AHSA1/START domain [Lutibacter sp. Hel_I_33_5]
MQDWTKFIKRISINKPVEDVFKCWATKAGIEKWLLEKADYSDGLKTRNLNELIQKGDTFIWKWYNWKSTESGEILTTNHKDVLSFSFGSAGNVHVQLNEAQNCTEVVLTQDNIPTDDKSKMEFYVGCSTGWTFWLANLKAYLEHNITLNEKGLNQDKTKDLVNS